MMTALCIVAGILCIGTALHDVFHTLFHPAGRGTTSDYIAGAVWKVFRVLGKRHYHAITLAGPAAIISIMAAWVVLVVVGFALIYAPYIQSHYVFAAGMPEHPRSFMDAINVALGALITLGGDINPTTRTLRFLEGIEAVFGFGILTANVSWLLSLYPVLERRRTVAHEITLLHNAEMETGISVLDLPTSEGEPVLWGFAGAIAELRNDMLQFPISYYFHSGEPQTGLSGAITYLFQIAEAASRPGMPASFRVAGISLAGAIDDYLCAIAGTFLHIPQQDKREIMRRYAQDQLRQTITRPESNRRRAG
jgi:hypothetical protein